MNAERLHARKLTGSGPSSRPGFPVLQRKCACGGSAGMEGECEECKKKSMSLQRRARSGGAAPAAAPPIVHDVLRSPGKPLDAGTRAFMEPRFGHDFSKVRVHADEPAAESARAVNALAYTVGNHIVFGRDRYAPHTPGGLHLLVHEAAHVRQQARAQWRSGALLVAPPDSQGEREAEAASHLILAGEPLSPASDLGPQVARQVPAEALPEPPPVRPPLRVITGGRAEPAPGGVIEPSTGPRYAPLPDTSIEGAIERNEQEARRERDILEEERPIATLVRGGKPPDFITVDGTKQIASTYGTATAKARSFHVLDAIEDAVSKATTETDLNRVLTRYIQYPNILQPAPYPLLPPSPALPGPDTPVFPSNFDPGGLARMEVYAKAVAKRTGQAPGLATSRAVARVPDEAKKRGCVVVPAAPLGDDPLATAFCQIVSGGSLEYRVVTPAGEAVQFDALIGNTAYECKCGYGRVFETWLKWKDTGEARYRWADLELDRRIEQARRQDRVASACGLTLRYYVSNQQFATLLSVAFNGHPLVLWHRLDECG